MANTTGKKWGGRQKGTPNKTTLDLLSQLKAVGCDPLMGMAEIAIGECDCTLCNGEGEVTGAKAKAENAALDEMVVCPKCGGDKRETISIETRGQMFKELAQYVAPKRKAIEVTGKDDGPLIVERVIYAPDTNTK